MKSNTRHGRIMHAWMDTSNIAFFWKAEKYAVGEKANKAAIGE
jgi:hypothetical protein